MNMIIQMRKSSNVRRIFHFCFLFSSFSLLFCMYAIVYLFVCLIFFSFFLRVSLLFIRQRLLHNQDGFSTHLPPIPIHFDDS